MRKWMIGALCALLMLCPCALADEAPTEVKRYVERENRGYAIEDYIEFRDTPTVAYGFVLLKDGISRKLSIFIGNPDVEMEFWTEQAGAVPTATNSARFVVYEKGETLIDVIDGSETVCDGLRFSVVVEDNQGETAQESVTYQFKETGFELVEYRYDIWNAVLREEGVEFFSSSDGETAFVKGLIDRDITYVDFERLPKTPQEARETLFAGEMPIGIFRSVRWYFENYRVEDYCEVPVSPEETYGLALMRREDERLLAFYQLRSHSSDDLLYGIKDALPAGAGKMRFLETMDGTVAVALENPEEEGAYEAELEMEWREEAFHLLRYMDYVRGEQALVRDGTLVFADGAIPVSLLTDIRCVDFDALPKTYGEAEKNPDIPPAIPMAVHPAWLYLQAQVLPMIEGRNHKVYLGPGEQYPRSGNGKGTVSTNSWVQVFGEYNGFLMVQYHIGDERYRIGWIKEPALKKGVRTTEFSFSKDEQEIVEFCELTDDPMGSGAAIAALEPGTPVRHLMFLGEEWEYIEVTVNGETYWGFVPSSCMSHG